MRLAGRFNVYNSLCAFAAAREMGVPIETVVRGLSEVNTVPGRFDRIHSANGFDVIVDYAHTDDALEKLLKSARELAPRRLITIFGCGGNRDRSKRPIMGRIAVALSDHAIVTSDNPRNEEPLDIINDILSGIEGGEYEVIPDREEAIGQAIAMAGGGYRGNSRQGA
jgi:UDP-N-acetylmuramoyl-L-alanyl-D-glutamate--2,6-diaminopimelate ligase